MTSLIGSMSAVNLVSATENAVELSVKTTMHAPLCGFPQVSKTAVLHFWGVHICT